MIERKIFMFAPPYDEFCFGSTRTNSKDDSKKDLTFDPIRLDELVAQEAEIVHLDFEALSEKQQTVIFGGLAVYLAQNVDEEWLAWSA